MKLTDRRYNNQVFKNTSFSNGGIAIWCNGKAMSVLESGDNDRKLLK